MRCFIKIGFGGVSKMTNPLKFLLGGLLGFALAVPAGIMQADVGLNRILHNTQWVIGPHVHVAILVGLTMTLYSAIYFLFPILTNGAKICLLYTSPSPRD